MDQHTKSHYESKSKDLRAALKLWETDWANTHNGSKPGRDDIKRNADIAQKYKDYNKVRDILSGKVAPPSKSEPRPSKRKPEPAPAETPLKRSKHVETPSKNRIQGEEYMNSPVISRKLFSPKAVTSLGPTPQKDGRVLGLFDLLVEKELGSPSKTHSEQVAPGTPARAKSTPSKRRSSISFDDDGAARLGRTPMSSGKRHMLNNFMTPLKKRDGNAAGAHTPSSVSKLQFDTPAFLKRHSLPTVDEGEGFNAPVSTLRLPRKPLARGLSEIVAGLRRVEEDKLDEDLEALHEMEAEEMGMTVPKKPLPPPPPPKKPDEILAPDSQVQNLPLGGFDDESRYDSPVEETRDSSLRVYKKKGQKRTTRKVNMRPTRTKRPTNFATGQRDAASEDGDDHDDEDELLAAETQRAGDAEHVPDTAEMGSDAEFEDAEPAAKTTKKKAAAPKEGKLKKGVKKVNELAHANFQRLKLKNNGAKGGPGFNSRFRRRR